MEHTIRWGILGPGKIARSFARDLELVNDGTLVAVASRDIQRATAFGAEWNVPLVFGRYQDLFECDEVDVIYIATPHTAHAPLAIRAMDHGKHVLCEKPMGVNGKEVEAMIASARRNKVFLMEALWTRFNPTIENVKALVDSGAIGELKYLHATFAFYALDREQESRLLSPVLAGGSLLDIGIYPAFLAYLMFGVPERIHSSSLVLKQGVDLQTSMTFDYKGGQAQLFSGLGGRTDMRAELSGTTGSIYLQPRWHETQAYTLVRDGEEEEFRNPTVGKGYSHEIVEVHHCLKQGQMESSKWSLSNTKDLIGILDAVRARNKLVFPFEE